jgi:hypothetical protein
MINERKRFYRIGGAVIACLMMVLVGASVAITAEDAGYELSVKTQYTQYYQSEKVETYGFLLHDGVGVPNAIIFLTYIDPLHGQHPGPGLGVRTDLNGKFTYTFGLSTESVLGTWTVSAVCHAPAIKAENEFEVVSTIVTVDAHGPYEGLVGEPIAFTGSATGGKLPYIWYWEFQDGGISDQQNPSHTYTAAGAFMPKLLVKDQGGYEAVDTTEVTVSESPVNPYKLIVSTDLPLYHPGDTINIFEHFTNDGVGVPGSPVCFEIIDPNGESIFGTCLLTNETGWVSFGYSLDPTALLGVYNVTGEDEIYHTTNYTTFQVALPPVAPNQPTITGPTSGVTGHSYDYSVVATDPQTSALSYYVDWGDGTNSGWTTPAASGTPVTISHSWSAAGTFSVKAKAKNTFALESVWSNILSVQISSPAAPNLTVEQFKGGFGLSAVVKNIGDAAATNVAWSIVLDGKMIFLGKDTSGTITSIAPGESVVIKTGLILGFGKTNIVATASCTEGATYTEDGSAKVLFFFVFGVTEPLP